MFAVFPVVRQLKELLWYLLEVSALLADGPLRDEVGQAQAQTTNLRAADLRGARLDRSLFVVQAQLDAATGDTATTFRRRWGVPHPGLQPKVAHRSAVP